ELDRFQAADAGNPDGRVWLLQGPGPRIDVVEEIVLRVPKERTRLSPGLDDEIQSLAKTLARRRRIDLVGVVFRTAADDHAGDEPAAAQDVEHGHFLGHAQRRIVKRQSIADDGDLDAAG